MDKVELKVENLVTSHKRFKISNISFKLESGDILGMMGRSGSGKSTVIKSLIGLKKPDKGKIHVKLNDKKTRIKKLLGYSSQSNSLFPFLSIEENLATFGKLYNLRGSEIRHRTDELLEQLKLEEARKKRIIELSGGMQKRADLAVALIHSPMILVLDEPFNGLDVSLQNFIWHLLKKLAKEGKIIIVSSHFIEDLEKYCNEFGLVAQSTYYNTSQIWATVNRTKNRSIDAYMQRLFAHLENIEK